MVNIFPLAGGILFVIWQFLMIGIVIGYIFLVIAIWRIMKAHQSISETLKEIKVDLKKSTSST